MLESEHNRQKFVKDNGRYFKSDPKLLKKYYDEDMAILQKTFKNSLCLKTITDLK